MRFKFIDNLTGLEDKNLKWLYSVGPKVGMIFGDSFSECDFLITDIVYKNNGNIDIYISLHFIKGEKLDTETKMKAFLLRKSYLQAQRKTPQ